MFGSLGSRRPRRRVPGWLWLLAGGMLAGAGMVLLVQERYLPPRLSAGESASLRQAHDRAEGEGLRLKAELADARQRLQAAQSDRTRLDSDLAASRALAERLDRDLALLVQALPPDPRGGGVEVRAGQFSAREGALDYLVVLLRQGGSRRPLSGVLQFSVAGESARGTPAALSPPPIALTLGSHLVMRGSLPLPEGFEPRETTVQVLDQAAGKPLGMRVLRVR